MISGWQQWPNRDPINEPGFNLFVQENPEFNMKEEVNLYRFVRNNSVQGIDPLGLDPIVDLLKRLKDIYDNMDDLSKCKKSPCDIPGSVRVICDCLWGAMGDMKSAGKELDKKKLEDSYQKMAECICLASDFDCLKKARSKVKAVMTTPKDP